MNYISPGHTHGNTLITTTSRHKVRLPESYFFQGSRQKCAKWESSSHSVQFVLSEKLIRQGEPNSPGELSPVVAYPIRFKGRTLNRFESRVFCDKFLDRAIVKKNADLKIVALALDFKNLANPKGRMANLFPFAVN